MLYSSGYRYYLTAIERNSHWLKAFPMANMEAETVARAIYKGWITRFGCQELKMRRSVPIVPYTIANAIDRYKTNSNYVV